LGFIFFLCVLLFVFLYYFNDGQWRQHDFDRGGAWCAISGVTVRVDEISQKSQKKSTEI